MNKLIVFAFFTLIVLALANEGPAQKGYYPLRSGQVLLKDLTSEDGQLFVLSEESLSRAIPATLKENSVADLLSHLLGTYPVKLDASRAAFPSSDLFNKPKALLLFNLPAALPCTSQKLQYRIEKLASPEDRLSRFVTYLTGAFPSEHGIVAKAWPTPTGSVKAFTSAESRELVSNFASLIAVQDSSSLTFSFSSDAQFASAAGVHEHILSANPAINSVVLSFNGQYNKIQGKSFGFENIDSSKDALLAALSAYDTSAFDAKTAAHAAFLAEAAFASSFADRLKEKELAVLVADNSADFYSFSFDSLIALKETPVYDAALSMINAIVEKLNREMSELYNGKIASVAVTIPADTPLTVPDQVHAIVFGYTTDEDKYLPYIYLNTEGFKVAGDICHELVNYNAPAACPESLSRIPELPHHVLHQVVYSEYELGNSTHHHQNLTDDDIALAQFSIWGSVALFLAFFSAIWALACMKNDDDTLLYRQAAGMGGPAHAHAQ